MKLQNPHDTILKGSSTNKSFPYFPIKITVIVVASVVKDSLLQKGCN